MMCAIQYPSWMRPEIIPGFPFLRWYGLMYIVAFSIAYMLFKIQVKKGELQKYSKNTVSYNSSPASTKTKELNHICRTQLFFV